MPEPIARNSSTVFVARMREVAAGRTVVWDFDGVVADTEPLQDASYRMLAERRGWSPKDGYFLTLVGRTEEEIWAELFATGFPVPDTLEAALPGLKTERKTAFVQLAEADLSPTWVAELLMPALDGVAGQQLIVSNGDPDVIERLMEKWDLLHLVTVARRSAGADKTALVERYCTPGSVLIEDNAGWIALGRSLGAVTVGVQHPYNAASDLNADYLLHL